MLEERTGAKTSSKERRSQPVSGQGITAAATSSTDPLPDSITRFTAAAPSKYRVAPDCVGRSRQFASDFGDWHTVLHQIS